MRERLPVQFTVMTRKATFAGTREAGLDFLVLVSGYLLVSGFKL